MNKTYNEHCFLANRVLCLRKLGFDRKFIHLGLMNDDETHNRMLLHFCYDTIENVEHAAVAIGDTSYLTFMKMYSLGLRVVSPDGKYNAETAKRDFILLGQAVEDIEHVIGKRREYNHSLVPKVVPKHP